MLIHFFSSDSPFLVGYALYFYTYSTWDGRVLYMEDLYVKPEFRGNKIGTQLWKAVTKVTNTIRVYMCISAQTSESLNTEKCSGSVYGCLLQFSAIFRDRHFIIRYESTTFREPLVKLINSIEFTPPWAELTTLWW